VMKPIAAPIVGGMVTSTIHVLILVPMFPTQLQTHPGFRIVWLENWYPPLESRVPRRTNFLLSVRTAWCWYFVTRAPSGVGPL